jgi:DNA-binding NarL/FixJ family response regulator
MKKGVEENSNNLIFVVEDNEVYSMMFDYILTKYSQCNVRRFTSGEECMDNIHLNPDIVILDYYLPKMDGLSTLKQIKKFSSGILVMVLTGQDDINVVKQLLDANVDKYFQKAKDPVQKVCKTIDSALFNIQEKKHKREKERTIRNIGVIALFFALVIMALYSAYH